jgi:iron only hydrogenase large subunit-like protein
LPWKNSSDKIRRRNRLRISQNGGNVLGDSNEVCLYRHVDNTYSFEKKDHANDEAVLCFSTAYGFKNIQLMMQRVSNGDMKMHGYHYVEVMACPAGCANGGGQTHAASGNRREKPSDMRERVEKTRQFMHDVLPRSKIGVAKDLSMSEPKSLLHTRFHVVPKLELSTGATAGVAVDDTQW